MDWRLISLTLLSLTTVIYLTLQLRRTLNALSRSINLHAGVSIRKEGTCFVFNLVLVNYFPKEVWAEECAVTLSEFDGIPSRGFQATCKGVLSIREFVRPNEPIRIGLCQTVYDAAGRPQDEYSFVISGTLKYRIKNNVWYSQPLPPRRVRMRGSDAIEVRGNKRFAACASQPIQHATTAD